MIFIKIIYLFKTNSYERFSLKGLQTIQIDIIQTYLKCTCVVFKKRTKNRL